MSAIIKKLGKGVHMSTRPMGGIFFDMSAIATPAEAKPITQTVPLETLKVLPWAPWGADNCLPSQYIADIEKCGVLNAIIEGKSRYALCQGMRPAIVDTDDAGQMVIKKYVNDDEDIKAFVKRNQLFHQVYGWMKDQMAFNWCVMRIMLDKAGENIVSIQRDDVTEIRFSRKDPKTGRSSHLYYSASWDKGIRSPNDERVFKIRLLNENNPLQDLEEWAEKGERQFAMVLRAPGWNKHYYPVPTWMATYEWVKIAQQVPVMKKSLFENSMRPKYKVIIMEEYWEQRFGTDATEWDEDKLEEEKNKVYDEIDTWLVGSKNAHKSIFVNGYRDGDGKTYTDIDIIPIEDTTKQGELLPDSAAANSEIAIGNGWNLAESGGNQKAGLLQGNEGGSNVRENMMSQVIKHEVERQRCTTFMDLVSSFNKWDVKHKGLSWVIPATILTTTDTGAGSKPVLTGGVNKKQDGADKNDSRDQRSAA